jgi:hypothetical protein
MESDRLAVIWILKLAVVVTPARVSRLEREGWYFVLGALYFDV